MIDVKIKLAPGARMPAYQSEGASGMDLHACIPPDPACGPLTQIAFEPYADSDGRLIISHELIDTGVSIELPPGYEAQVRPRSSLSKRGIVAAFGTIDQDYRGTIGVVLYNLSDEDFVVRDGDRIAQLVVVPICRAVLTQVDELSPTARGAAGWGSTGSR